MVAVNYESKNISSASSEAELIQFLLTKKDANYKLNDLVLFGDENLFVNEKNIKIYNKIKDLSNLGSTVIYKSFVLEELPELSEYIENICNFYNCEDFDSCVSILASCRANKIIDDKMQKATAELKDKTLLQKQEILSALSDEASKSVVKKIGLQSQEEVVLEEDKRVEEMMAGKQRKMVKTYYKNYDKFIDDGFRRKQVYVIGGAPKTAKSTLKDNLIWRMCENQLSTGNNDGTIVNISLEGESALTSRKFISMALQIKEYDLFRNPNIYLTRQKDILREKEKQSRYNLKNYSGTRLNTDEIRAILKTVKNISVCFIDHFGNIDIPERDKKNIKNAQDHAEYVANAIQDIAEKLDITIVVLIHTLKSTWNNNMHKGSGSEAGLADLADYGRLTKNCASAVILIRPLTEDGEFEENYMDLKCVANRFGKGFKKTRVEISLDFSFFGEEYFENPVVAINKKKNAVSKKDIGGRDTKLFNDVPF